MSIYDAKDDLATEDRLCRALTHAVRSLIALNTPVDPLGPEIRALRMIERALEVSPEFNPITLRDRPLSAETTRTLRLACSKASDSFGDPVGSRRYAPVDNESLELLNETDLLPKIEEAFGRELFPRSASFIQYDASSHGQELHLDTPRFGNVNVLLRLDVARTAQSSCTVTLVDGNWSRFPLEVGQVLIFNGTRTWHGRTRLASTEAVQLLSIGCATETWARDDETIQISEDSDA
jgi:hypothetical protein